MTHELCPFGCYQNIQSTFTPNKPVVKFSGLVVDVIQCALDNLDIELELKVVPWVRAQKMVENTKADGFFAASQNSERDKFATFSDIIYEHHWRWYYLKNNPINFNSPTLTQEVVVTGYTGSNTLKWLKGNKFVVSVEANSSEALLRLLLIERADLLLASENVLDKVIKKAGIVEQVESVLHSKKLLGVYFSNHFLARYPQFLAQFNQQIPNCK